jgi:hypothetical protein
LEVAVREVDGWNVKKGSEVFRGVLEAARDQLWLDFRISTAFEHHGIRGGERERALKRFLEVRLPPSFGVTTGEMIDRSDCRTGQLDLIIYDKSIAQPVLAGDAADLMPCEAVYAVIETKSVLTKAEAESCTSAAAKVRSLRPVGGNFVDSRTDGAGARSGEYRCMYMVFAYSSDLALPDWLKNEYERFETAARDRGSPVECIDRVVVLDRGLFSPGLAKGVVADDDPVGLFGETYMHLVNFLERERTRRPDFSWQRYAGQSLLKWVALKPMPPRSRAGSAQPATGPVKIPNAGREAHNAKSDAQPKRSIGTKPAVRVVRKPRPKRPPYKPGRATPGT